MPELIAEKTVRARKPHRCRTCNQIAVQPGEEYRRQTYRNDGVMYDWVMCTACTDAVSYVREWSLSDDGIGMGTYEDWSMDIAWEADTDPADQTGEQRAAVAYQVRRFGSIVDHVWTGVNGHPDDPECTHRSDGTDATYCGHHERDHLWSSA